MPDAKIIPLRQRPATPERERGESEASDDKAEHAALDVEIEQVWADLITEMRALIVELQTRIEILEEGVPPNRSA